jgi:pyruvate,water dikinase
MTKGTTSTQLVYFFGAGQAEGGVDLKHLVGGKGASLADMTKAGLNVPPGFTISAACCEEFHGQGGQWPTGLDKELRANLHRLETLTGRAFGHGDNPLLVAVRSGAAVSMPGMMDTVLNIGRPGEGDPWDVLRRAIEAVFSSWRSERAVLYRRHHQIDGLLGTAVTVQAMCPAEVSGVLFTADPIDPSRQQIVIEAAPGLGEALVLGKATPNRYTLEKPALRVLERLLVHEALLSDDQLAELGRLGLHVEAHFGHPCDIEWAWSGGQFYLLQSRPIKQRTTHHLPLTTHHSAECEQVRQAEIAALRARAEPAGTVWARFNLSEILPAPTPMTWAIVRRFTSGRGGFGLMYRDLGFDPDPALDDEGVYDLICGRPYCNLSREPRLHFRLLPFAHNFAALKAAPHKALYPQPTIDTVRAGWRFWLFAPIIIPRALIQMIRAELRQREMAQSLPKRLRDEVFPSFAAETANATAEDLTRLDEQALLERLETWTRRTLVNFARDSLKPTALAGLAMGKVERLLLPALGRERTRAAVGELVMGVHPDPEADLPRAMRELAAGTLDRAPFLSRFGHRGSQEMELSQPRWSESFTGVAEAAWVAGAGVFGSPALSLAGASEDSSPGHPQDTARERLFDEAKLAPAQRAALAKEIETLHTCLALRETAKHYLMKGYAEIRRVLLELDRRHGLDGGIFFLTPEELPRLVQGDDLFALIAERRQRREIALSLDVPQVLFSDGLEAIGRPVEAAAAETLRGVALSAGVAEGAALVLHTPDASPLPTEPYILVCPSTDPAWLPLFVRAKGLVMETGGVLSHGAIVAREFGLPAVAGLADVHHRIRSGQRLRVDGGAGTVSVLSAGSLNAT